MHLDPHDFDGQAFLADTTPNPFAARLRSSARSYAVAIRRTLAAAEYAPADTVIVKRAADRLAACCGNLDLAIRDTMTPAGSVIETQVDSLLFNYKIALREAGRPHLIAARFERWAADNDYYAAKHRETEVEYLAKAGERREQAKTWAPSADVADDFDRRAAAAASCAHTCEQLSIRYRARAAALAGQKLVAA